MLTSCFRVLWISGNRLEQRNEIRSFDLGRSSVQEPVDHREIELRRLSVDRGDEVCFIVGQLFQPVQNAPEYSGSRNLHNETTRVR